MNIADANAFLLILGIKVKLHQVIVSLEVLTKLQQYQCEFKIKH